MDAVVELPSSVQHLPEESRDILHARTYSDMLPRTLFDCSLGDTLLSVSMLDWLVSDTLLSVSIEDLLALKNLSPIFNKKMH